MVNSKMFFQTMKDGTEISVNRWIPEVEPKAVILISHGMGEHSLRYDRVANLFAEDGFAVSVHDHRGHGRTAQKQKEKGEPGFGYLADKNGYEKVRDDIIEIKNKLQEDFPGKKIFLLGHSFGSMVSQGVIEEYGDQFAGCILCGTRGPDLSMVKFGKNLAKLGYLIGLKKRKANLLNKISFSGSNSRIKNLRTPFDWLTKDDAIVDMYMSDQWCGFVMKTEFFHEMFKMLLIIHNEKNMKKVPENLPVSIIYGTEDPVGAYGKTPEILYNVYKANGLKDVSITSYENDRHELFNETDYEKVVKDTEGWIEKHLK